MGEVNATAQWCLPHPLTGHESQKAESHENLQIHAVNIYQRRSRLLFLDAFDFRFVACHSVVKLQRVVEVEWLSTLLTLDRAGLLARIKEDGYEYIRQTSNTP